MNYREDLEIKLQKVTLAMQEVVDDIHKSDPAKKKYLCFYELKSFLKSGIRYQK